MAPITIIPKACSCCKGERSSRDKSSNLPLPNILYEGSEGRLTGLRPEGCGRLSAAGYVRFAQGATALRAEGCGIAPWAMSIKSALRDLLSVPYGMISILQWKTI